MRAPRVNGGASSSKTVGTVKASIPEHDRAEHYARMGFALVSIPYGSKGPKGKSWQHNTITTPEHAALRFKHRLNIGLEHGKSETGTLDIDAAEDAALALEYVGLDLEKILEHPTLKIRGKNAAKPLYDLARLDLPYFKLSWPHPSERLANGKPKYYTVLELRAGPGKQDLLPPSLHPDGMLYTWEPQPPRSRAALLAPPPDLLTLWQDPERLSLMRQACPWREVEAPTPRAHTPTCTIKPGENVIAAFNAKHNLKELLESYGYEHKGYGRYLPPESSTSLAGAVVYSGQDGLERVVVHNASSPLCQQDALGKTRGVTSFGVWLEYEHGGNLTEAVKAAAEELGMTYEKAKITLVTSAKPGKTYNRNIYARLRGWR